MPAGSTDVEVRLQPTGSGEVCRAVLATLPTWFGFPDVNEEYARPPR